ETFGSVAPPIYPIQGCPHILNANQAEGIYSLLDNVPEIYLDKIQDWLVLAHDVHTSKTALFKNIRDAGLTYKILQKTASDRDNDLREEWLQDINTHFTARQFIMIDETNKNDWTIYQYYGQAPKGRRAMVQANFVWGEHYGPGAALTLDGYLSAMDIFHITVNGKDFFDFCFKQCGMLSHLYLHLLF
ncbi:hypothetical protein SERLA73DRAFT_49731, partial [Serpula lacrymans var. lacrymans S7.3]